MEILKFDKDNKASRDFILVHGRIYEDSERNALWFNWTGSGFSVRFSGEKLEAELLCCPLPFTSPYDPDNSLMYPVIGVFADNKALQRHKLAEGVQTLTLFEGGSGEHTVCLRKISENVMGMCALLSLKTDGRFLDAPEAKPLKIEFVGDSITCGYGIESDQPGLRTEDENGTLTYGFLTCEALNADYSAICVSGCGTAEPVFSPQMENRGMYLMYNYTDAPFDRYFGNLPMQEWSFKDHKKDAVILNLGTNDGMDLSWQDFAESADQAFRRNYRSLIELIRSCNGPETLIVCTLGPMRYYLWDEILEIIKEYISDTGDARILWYKFGEMNMMKEGTGSDGHPSVRTHARMAAELTRFLKGCL